MNMLDFAGLITGDVLPEPHDLHIPEENEEFLQAYLESTLSALESLETAAMALDANKEGADDSIRHLLHGMKGEAGIMGLMAINELCHETETAFEQLEASPRTDMVLRAKDWIATALNQINEGPSPAEAPTPKSGRLHCLVVEDEFTSRKLIQAFLAPHADCDVAVNGNEAVDAFKHAIENGSPYDLICLDIMMPEMDGHQALKIIRSIESDHGVAGLDAVKVIMTTALSGAKDILSAFRTGCEAYVVKPIQKRKFLAELKKLGLIA